MSHRRRRCVIANCQGRATYGSRAIKLHCAQHRLPNETILSYICKFPDCEKVGTYGINCKKTHCATHKLAGETRWRKTCQFPYCDSLARFGIDNAQTHCSEHKTCGETKYVRKSVVAKEPVFLNYAEPPIQQVPLAPSKRLHIPKSDQCVSPNGRTFNLVIDISNTDEANYVVYRGFLVDIRENIVRDLRLIARYLLDNHFTEFIGYQKISPETLVYMISTALVFD